MIVVKVELWSAITGDKTELARMHISNDGQQSTDNFRLGAYDGETFIGRDDKALSRGTVSKRGRVERWPRADYHIWNLVARMLESMGYDKQPRK